MEFLSNTIPMKAEESVYSKVSESQMNYNVIDGLSVTNFENWILLHYQKCMFAEIRKKSLTAFP